MSLLDIRPQVARALRERVPVVVVLRRRDISIFVASSR